MVGVICAHIAHTQAMTIQKLDDGRMWVEFNLPESEYQSLLEGAKQAGAPSVAAYLRYVILTGVAAKLGNPNPVMPWKPHAVAKRQAEPNLEKVMGMAEYNRMQGVLAAKREAERELIGFAERLLDYSRMCVN